MASKRGEEAPALSMCAYFLRTAGQLRHFQSADTASACMLVMSHMPSFVPESLTFIIRVLSSTLSVREHGLHIRYIL